jgi:Ni2+-binding GTPase involved in maturation of urease and hydrogenase
MRLHLVGGFLGSGKTTAILQAAEILSDQGIRVGIVTNEQGKHLVDTGLFQSKVLPALEVTGGCICCHLDDFNERVNELMSQYNPDVIFAESVGSCTDLVATVIKPLLNLRKDFAFPTSLSVFTDARLFARLINGLELPFSDGVVYILEKQLDEAELIIINKIDLLDEEKKGSILRQAQVKYPGKRFRVQNSLQREQVADWLEILNSSMSPLPQVSLDIDYDRYAHGEQGFSWVDRKLDIRLVNLDQQNCLVECIMEISRKVYGLNRNLAHLKFLLRDHKKHLKFSLTALDDPEIKLADISEQVHSLKNLEYELWINAMAECPLDVLEKRIDTVIQEVLAGVEYSVVSGFTRVPGYPKPTMRIGN